MDILQSMEQTATAARLLIPSPMLNVPNYVSVFRIDGVPILPPLMTNEKRKQMKKIKQKAMELEKQLEAKRSQRVTMDLQEQGRENGKVPHSPPLSEQCPSARSNFSSASQCSSEVTPNEQDSYLLLSNIMKSAQDRREFRDSSTCTQKIADNDAEALLLEKTRQVKARMQKLQKSETLIYDNCSNTIIMPINSQQSVAAKQQGNDYELKQVLEQPNIGYNSLEQQIPVICVNPPTPMLATRNFCEKLNTTIDSLTGDLLSRESSDEPSTDESGNFNPATNSLKTHKKVTNITAKIIQFETFCDGDSGVLERLEPPCMKPPVRSATSPSLKPMIVSSPNSAKIVHHKSNVVDSHTDNPLLRSNSFTLDCPSKALLDHIRQQKITAATTQNQNVKRSCYPSASATRDTVESKAKRVQKVELKQRPQAMRNAAKPTALSPYTANYTKKQRSPYELKAGHKTKVLRSLKTATTTPSATGITAPRQVKPKNSLTTLTTRMGSNHNKNNATSKMLEPELLTEIEAEHRQKFVQLVAQQNEEKKRLQQAFETQQKLLLEQISVDMDKVQFSKRSAANPLIPSSEEMSPISGSELSDHAHKLSPPLSLSSSANSYSVVSSTICDLTASTEDVGSLESTITTTTTTLASNRQCTPRRRLFSREHSPTLSTANISALTAATTATAAANKRQIFSQQREYHLENQRRYEAATKICACARGFLTRRLFQTEQIQRIVQTIRDTLIFVLNLHIESTECPEEANTAANIKLKARLLQQLSSASRTLHLVFFQTTIKDRMDIIARDRKRIKTKLLSMNTKRSPRIGT